MQTPGLNSELKVPQANSDLYWAIFLYRNESEQKSVEEEHKIDYGNQYGFENELSGDAIENKQQKLNAKNGFSSK